MSEFHTKRIWCLGRELSDQESHGLKLMLDTYYDMKDAKIFKTLVVKQFDFNPSIHYHLHEEFIDEVKEELKIMMQKER